MRGLSGFIKGGDITNKPCGIGSVGFPRPLLPVAIRAVSLENERRAVSGRATELPLSPHCNLCYILIDSLGAFLGSVGSSLATFAGMVSHSDRTGFREPLVTARCSMIRHTHSWQATLQAALVPPCRFSRRQRRRASTKNGSNSIMPLTAAHNSYSQQRPPTGRQQPLPGTSSICPLTDF